MSRALRRQGVRRKGVLINVMFEASPHSPANGSGMLDFILESRSCRSELKFIKIYVLKLILICTYKVAFKCAGFNLNLKRCHYQIGNFFSDKSGVIKISALAQSGARYKSVLIKFPRSQHHMQPCSLLFIIPAAASEIDQVTLNV